MPNYLARLFYLGNRYHGSQYQPNLVTVQGELIEALSKWSGEHHSTQTVQISGRTDRGVHSIGQLAMFITEKEFNIDKINRHLPDDIILWAFTTVSSDFVPRYNILMRHYRYYLDKSWGNLNLREVKKGISRLIGSNDYSQLSKPDVGRNTTTTTTLLNISIHNYNDTYFLDVFGTRFLWKLVRKIVTLLIEIGQERIRPEEVTEILLGHKALSSGIQPAPPENLVLVESVTSLNLKTSKYAIRNIRNLLDDQLEQYRRSIRTAHNIIDYFSEPKLTFQHSTKSRNPSNS